MAFDIQPWQAHTNVEQPPQYKAYQPPPPPAYTPGIAQTGPGYKDQRVAAGFGDNPENTLLRRLTVGGEFPLLSSRYQFAQELEPQRQQQIRQALNMMSHPELLAELQRRAVLSQAPQVGLQMANNLRASGAGIGAIQGAQADAMNQAYHTANNFMSQLYTPQGMMSALAPYLQLMGQETNPSLQNALSIAQALHGGQQPSQPNNTIGQIAPVLAAAITKI